MPAQVQLYYLHLADLLWNVLRFRSRPLVDLICRNCNFVRVRGKIGIVHGQESYLSGVIVSSSFALLTEKEAALNCINRNVVALLQRCYSWKIQHNQLRFNFSSFGNAILVDHILFMLYAIHPPWQCRRWQSMKRDQHCLLRSKPPTLFCLYRQVFCSSSLIPSINSTWTPFVFNFESTLTMHSTSWFPCGLQTYVNRIKLLANFGNVHVYAYGVVSNHL